MMTGIYLSESRVRREWDLLTVGALLFFPRKTRGVSGIIFGELATRPL